MINYTKSNHCIFHKSANYQPAEYLSTLSDVSAMFLSCGSDPACVQCYNEHHV